MLFLRKDFFCQYTVLPCCLWCLSGESSRRWTLPKGCLGLWEQSCSDLRTCIKCLSYNVFRSHNCRMALEHSYMKRKGVTGTQLKLFLGWQPTHPPIPLATDWTSVQLQKCGTNKQIIKTHMGHSVLFHPVGETVQQLLICKVSNLCQAIL